MCTKCQVILFFGPWDQKKKNDRILVGKLMATQSLELGE